ncbi:HdlA1: heterodisulfide reductase-like protein, iron-sulfur subunit [uncultured Desulfobacterium sp.]|uniref:HdlA1: heterodisulfide reductase-like protein, iron-sulfur subunit n=1 Tax=uncultured Desulfobacterium sp. TaxID=201089 RepID=A0A445N0V5_9BACT|nr:HdlA1: heterodisulfide reductase-like protein, iron-sulfur subunit [uncultured Desulfobacterium sp.]
MSDELKGSVMVVGGGVAGIQASLDLADSGYYVYLVERRSAIGGVMAQLDKTFPTNDCSMCIISPKLVEAGRHLNIELMTLTEIEEVTGEAGNFTVRLLQQPRFIDMEKCTACGECAKACPVDLPNQFDEGLSDRKAAYKLYPQAMPGAYVIEKTGKAPCRLACPAGINVQGYVQMVKEGKYKEALEIIMEDLPLPGVLGRICPHGCEDACRRCDVDNPVAIRDLKRLAADQFDPREILIECLPGRDEKVAIIGSGPAGLSAAYHLAKNGIKPTIFEALSEAGGMLRVGIPDHRLPRKVLDREIEIITKLGVEIKLNSPLGPDLTVDYLLNDGYKVVYLAIGAHKGIELGVPGEKAEGVRQGVDFLRELNLTGKAKAGKKVAIIGGGNVAIDVARSAARMNADEVNIIYRRTRSEMPAWEEEIKAAETEGVKITYLSAPQEILTIDGKVSGVRCIRMELGEPDSSGRRRPVPIPGSEYDLEIDQLIPAIGQRPDLSSIEDVIGVKFSRWGTVEVDPITYATKRDGVFAGGDLQTGPWVAIGAIAAGREAAESIIRYLDGRDMAEGREPITKENPIYRPILVGEPKKERAKMPELSPDERKGNFNEVELGYDKDAGAKEAARCLNCGYCSECLQCADACMAGAVDHRMRPVERTVQVGGVILAPGFTPFDPSPYSTYLYGHHPNVVTSIEFERMLSASGPFQGRLVRPSDHKEPEKIAWLQCVGSRDINRADHGYCSSVCCMYAVKQSVIAKEHSGKDVDAAIFYMDMRTFGKDFDRYRNRAEDENHVRFIRARVHTIDPVMGDDLKIRYVTESGEIVDELFDLIVLSIGLSPVEGVVELANRLGIELNHHGFINTKDLAPVKTSREGIYVCGASQAPKDIPQSVMEASAAAAAATERLANVRNTMTRTRKLPEEIDVSGQKPRIGVFVCNCGINIGGIADVPAVREYAKGLPNVVHVEDNLFTCSQDNQDKIKNVIKEHGINRVVVASCSPRTHEPLFQETIREAGLNPYLFEMANIRDQNTWVHMHNPDIATQKAKDLVRMAVAKAAHIEPLHEVTLGVKQAVLVIGGGIAGMEAALGMADQGFQAFLVERSDILGGVANMLHTTWRDEKIEPYLTELIRRINDHERVRLFLRSEAVETTGIIGNFLTTIITGRERITSTTVEHGATILATGGMEYKPDEYLYGRHPSVMTHLDLDEALRNNSDTVTKAETIVFIQCVGSRIPDRPYCSRLCCTHSLKSALKFKEQNPHTKVVIIYRDIRSYGFREDLYKEARKKGVVFIRYDEDRRPEALLDDQNRLILTAWDHILQRPVQMNPDLLVLAAAVLPNENRDLFELFKVPVNSDGFLVEAHAKLRPVEFASEGLFLAGLAHYPKSVDETIAQAMATVSRAMTILAKDSIKAGGVVADLIDPSRCAACLACVRSCPYCVPRIREGRAVIEPAECHGCGVCAAECPAKVITLKHFTDEQILAKSHALFDRRLKAA